MCGEAGSDQLWGGSGDDALHGNDGSDLLFGGGGNDRLDGGEDDDFLLGNYGDDKLAGGAGDDLLWGGEGADTLHGGGNDTLHRSPSADVFDFTGANGADLLFGFSDGEGLIDLSDYALSGFGMVDARQMGNDVRIDLREDDGGIISLRNFDLADLDAADFLF